MEIKVRRCRPNASLPFKASTGAACWDVSAAKQMCIRPHSTKLIPTGLAFEVPTGFYLDIRQRSGLFKDGLITLHGTLDSDYRGELLIGTFNYEERAITIEEGARIAQVTVVQIILHGIKEVEFLSETERGSDGFGSTG